MEESFLLRMALALFKHIQTHHDGGILLLTDGAGGLVAHLDGLGAVHQLDAVQRNVVLGGGLAHQRLVAHADQLHAVLLDGLCSAFQNSQRGVVAAHHVHNDLHTCFLLSGGLPYRAVSSSQCWKLATARIGWKFLFSVVRYCTSAPHMVSAGGGGSCLPSKRA